jgi:hypothetical protein
VIRIGLGHCDSTRDSSQRLATRLVTREMNLATTRDSTRTQGHINQYANYAMAWGPRFRGAPRRQKKKYIYALQCIQCIDSKVVCRPTSVALGLDGPGPGAPAILWHGPPNVLIRACSDSTVMTHVQLCIFETLHANHVSNSFYLVFRRESQVIQRKLLPHVYAYYAKQVYLGFCGLHGQHVTDHSLL